MSISGSLVMQSLILSPIFMGALTTQSKAMMDGDGNYSWMNGGYQDPWDDTNKLNGGYLNSGESSSSNSTKPLGNACFIKTEFGNETVYLDETVDCKSMQNAAEAYLQKMYMKQLSTPGVGEYVHDGKKCSEDKLNYGYLDNQVIYGHRANETSWIGAIMRSAGLLNYILKNFVSDSKRC
jgi:hypothetical protein